MEKKCQKCPHLSRKVSRLGDDFTDEFCLLLGETTSSSANFCNFEENSKAVLVESESYSGKLAAGFGLLSDDFNC